jgi:hypothetical protein
MSFVTRYDIFPRYTEKLSKSLREQVRADLFEENVTEEEEEDEA